MKKLFMVIAAVGTLTATAIRLVGCILLVGLAFASTSSAQTTYTQTNRVCLLYECTKAQFHPQALLSYDLPEVFNQLNQGKTNISFTNQYAFWCTGSLTCTQTEYADFNGSLVRTDHGTDPNCPLSTQCWYLIGTFNAGTVAVNKKWECFRSCGNQNDISGSVTVQ